MNKWFKVKQRVELHIQADGKVLNLSTHIEHVKDDGEFIVAAPFYKGQLYPFLAKEHVEMLSIVEGVGIISCDVIVQRRLRNGAVVLVLLERISEIRKTQRRRHYRLPTLLDAEVEPTDRMDFSSLQAIARDISAGGIRCITPEKLFEREHVKLKVDLNGEVLNLHSSVLESFPINPDDFRFETRFMFDEIPLEQERMIVGYIFEEQRRRRKRG